MLQNCSIFKTAQVFFDYPTKKHSLKDVSVTSHVAHTSTKQNLNKLEKLRIIRKKSERHGSRVFPKYFADLDSLMYKLYKKQHNQLRLYSSGLIAYLEDFFMPNAIVLFGSFDRGEDVESSDIDIFVEAGEKEVILKKFEKKLSRKIELHFQKNFNTYPLLLQNTIINGTILSGQLSLKYEEKS